MCDEKISASVGTSLKAHVPTRTSKLEKHLGRLYPEILKLVPNPSGTPTASNTKTLSAGKKPATENLTKLFASDKVSMTMTPDAFRKHY